MTNPGWWTEKFISLQGIPSSISFGNISTVPDPVDIYLDGIESGVEFGNPVVGNRQIIGLQGISSGVAFGDLIVVPPPQEISLIGIPSKIAFGGSSASPGDIDVDLIGISSKKAFGALTVIGPDQSITLGGVGPSEAFGTLDVEHEFVPSPPSAFTSSGTYDLPPYATEIDYCLLGGGAGGGHGGTLLGGSPGQWAIGTLIVGVDIKTGSTITIVIGTGGAGGSGVGELGHAGVATTISYQDPSGTVHVITGSPGGGGGPYENGGAVTPLTQVLNGNTYTGGALATYATFGTVPGHAPGGGGAAATGAYIGGAGAKGEAWLYAHI